MMESRRVVLTFESVDETLSCDRSNESYWAVLSCDTVFIMLYKVVLTFESVTIQMKALCQYFHMVLFVFQHFTK